MKKLLAIITALAVMVSSLGMIAFAQESSVTVEAMDPVLEADLKEAREFVEQITGKVLFEEGEVTRIAYLNAMLDFMKITCAQDYDEYFFNDVKSFSEYASTVYTAYEKGWISRDTFFGAERVITPTEALKILVRAMNYGLIAESKGGYPAGDLYVANTLDLTENVDMSAEGLNGADAYKLMFNAICAPTLEQVSFGDTEEYKKTGDSLLKQIYGIYTIEGMVSRTPYNTLSGSESAQLGDVVEIDGVAYKSTIKKWDIIGCYARAFVKESKVSKDEIIYLRDLSEKITVNLSDFAGKSGNTLSYWRADGGKLRTEKLSVGCQYIYNGRKLITNIDSYLKRGAGELVLADNDNNGTYDTVFINSYSYISVLSYDSVNEVISDRNSAEFTLKIDDIPFILKNENGEDMDPIDIGSDSTFRVEKSADGGFVKLTRIEGAISGIVNEINRNEELIVVDDTEYVMSDYFIATSLSLLETIPVEISLICDGNVIVAAAPDGENMKYGYLVGAKWTDGMETDLMVRIFTQSGSFDEYIVREKIIIDGVKNNNRDTFYNAVVSDGETAHQLIRFGLDGNGELRAIDFATDVLPDAPGVYGDPLNKLTHYSFTNAVRYRSSLSSMSTLYTVVNSIVFNIPDDINDDDKFLASNKDMFINDRQYTASDLDVYNLDAYGCAEAVVYHNDNPNQTNPDSIPMLIRSVNNVLDEDGNEAYAINGWCNGQFTTKYLSYDVEVAKISKNSSAVPVKSVHPLLSGGDIVRFGTDTSGDIRSLDVIFDARENVFAMNDSRVNQINYDSPQYYVGKIYDVGNNFAVISISGDDFSQENLRYASVNTKNIVRYNARTGDTRPVDISEIKTYKSNGTDAHYAVFCMNNLITKTVVLYEETEAR